MTPGLFPAQQILAAEEKQAALSMGAGFLYSAV